MGNVCIARSIDHRSGQDGPSARFTLGDDSLNRPPFHHRIDGQAVQKRPDARFLDEPVSYVLEHLCIQCLVLVVLSTLLLAQIPEQSHCKRTFCPTFCPGVKAQSPAPDNGV